MSLSNYPWNIVEASVPPPTKQLAQQDPECGMTSSRSVWPLRPAKRRAAAVRSLSSASGIGPLCCVRLVVAPLGLAANALTGDHALDETELEPFRAFDDEWALGHFGERPSQEMLVGHRDRNDFQRALHPPGDAR